MSGRLKETPLRREAIPPPDRLMGAGLRLGFVVLIAVGAACRPDEPRLDTPPDTLPPISEVMIDEAEPVPGIDVEVLRGEADGLDGQVLELRRHIGTMRQISPRMAATVMDAHAEHVRAIAERVREQRVELPVEDGELARLMGMSPDEYRVLLEEIQLAGAEVAELLAAEETAIRELLPGHLDRLERIAGQLEQGAAGLRR